MSTTFNLPCAPIITCSDAPDSSLYSLEDIPLPFVLVCPPGFDCSQSNSITLNCCGNVLTASLAGMTPNQRSTTITNLVTTCLRDQLFCGGNTTTILYFNAPAQCPVTCPDGTIFIYTIPAGSFLSSSQATANAQAYAQACKLANQQLICLGDIPKCLCVGTQYSATLTTTSPPQLLTWSANGNVPPGLTVHTDVQGINVLIDGTPTASGMYTFFIVATGSNGSYMQKAFTVTVLQITTLTLPAYTIGVHYSFQLTAQGGSGNYSWSIGSGTLPNGLIMSTTGLISGTPTS